MRSSTALAAAAAGLVAITAAAATLGSVDDVSTPKVTVVSGPPASIVPAVLAPVACATGANCWNVADAPVSRCNFSNDPDLRDVAYFATAWHFLEENAGDPPLYTSGGWFNVRVERDPDGKFFAGIAEKRSGDGTVTDVVVAFTGANTADDFASAAAFINGNDTPQLQHAIAVYESVLGNPRYAGARFHVTGFSLGAGLTEYLLGYTLASRGENFADARATFTGFGVPGWAQGAANRYGLPISAFDGRFHGYLPENDVVHLLGSSRMAVDHLLAPYAPVSVAPGVPLNGVIAHSPYPYMTAIGLPDWLGDRKAATALQIQQKALLPTDPSYGSPGTVAVHIIGDGGHSDLTGSAVADRIENGAGSNRLCGGSGGDTFVYAVAGAGGGDRRIVDFNQKEGDRIDLSGLVPPASGQSLFFIGRLPFSGPRQVRVYQEAGDTVVAINLDSDFGADLTIRLSGAPNLVAKNFVLSR